MRERSPARRTESPARRDSRSPRNRSGRSPHRGDIRVKRVSVLCFYCHCVCGLLNKNTNNDNRKEMQKCVFHPMLVKRNKPFAVSFSQELLQAVVWDLVKVILAFYCTYFSVALQVVLSPTSRFGRYSLCAAILGILDVNNSTESSAHSRVSVFL